jgi:hypothetical protein
MADGGRHGWKFRVTIPIADGDSKLGYWFFDVLASSRQLAREWLKREARAHLPQIQRLLSDAEIEDLEKGEWPSDSESRGKLWLICQEAE